jgi:hypothetical protein
MAHFAHINPATNTVTQVIVIEPEVLERNGGWPILGQFRVKEEFVQTSYNTQNGKHTKGGQPLRKNYAAAGYTYDDVRDAFIPPKPHKSWTLNEETCNWEAPVKKPENGKPYRWNEKTGSWKEHKEI